MSEDGWGESDCRFDGELAPADVPVIVVVVGGGAGAVLVWTGTAEEAVTSSVSIGVAVAAAVEDDGAFAAGAATAPALMLRWTVSPSLIPSYSLRRRSSAIAFPLNSHLCLSASGAPAVPLSLWSWALSSEIEAVRGHEMVKERTGLSDFTFSRTTVSLDDPVAEELELDERVSGGCTTGTCVGKERVVVQGGRRVQRMGRGGQRAKVRVRVRVR